MEHRDQESGTRRPVGSASLRIALFVTNLAWYGLLLASALFLMVAYAQLAGHPEGSSGDGNAYVEWSPSPLPVSLRLPLKVTAPVVDTAHPELEYTLVEATARVLPEGGRPFLFTVVFPVLGISLLLCAAYVFRELLRSVAAGSVFESANVHRIRLLGTFAILVAVGEWVAYAELWWFHLVHLTAFGGPMVPDYGISNVLLGAPMDYSLLLCGIIGFVLADVFRQGVELQEESDGTV